MNHCILLLLSWIMVGLGFYVYEIAGLGYAFVPFLVAALIRGDRDKQVSDFLFRRQPWGIVTGIYYFLLLIVALLQPRRFTEASGAAFVLVLALPLAIMAMWNDIVSCTRREK